jgi:hypothetical protein
MFLRHNNKRGSCKKVGDMEREYVGVWVCVGVGERVCGYVGVGVWGCGGVGERVCGYVGVGVWGNCPFSAFSSFPLACGAAERRRPTESEKAEMLKS